MLTCLIISLLSQIIGILCAFCGILPKLVIVLFCFLFCVIFFSSVEHTRKQTTIQLNVNFDTESSLFGKVP